MRKLFIILLLLSIFGIIVIGQQKEATISFTNDKHYFGDIEEAKGSVTHTFSFTNTCSDFVRRHKDITRRSQVLPQWLNKQESQGGYFVRFLGGPNVSDNLTNPHAIFPSTCVNSTFYRVSGLTT